MGCCCSKELFDRYNTFQIQMGNTASVTSVGVQAQEWRKELDQEREVLNEQNKILGNLVSNHLLDLALKGQLVYNPNNRLVNTTNSHDPLVQKTMDDLEEALNRKQSIVNQIASQESKSEQLNAQLNEQLNEQLKTVDQEVQRLWTVQKQYRLPTFQMDQLPQLVNSGRVIYTGPIDIGDFQQEGQEQSMVNQLIVAGVIPISRQDQLEARLIEDRIQQLNSLKQRWLSKSIEILSK